MTNLRACLVAAVAAGGCGGPTKGGNGVGNVASGDCPDPGAIHVVSIDRGDGERPPRLVLHEAIVPSERDDLFGEEADAGEKPITAEVARAHGATSGPTQTVFWDKAPPCKATAGGYRAVRGGDGMYFTDIVRDLTGCPIPEGAYAGFAAEGSVGATCRYVVAEQRSQRSFEAGVAKGDAAPPAVLASVLPATACDTPKCQRNWRVVAVGDYYDMMVSDVRPEGEGECDWPVEDTHTFSHAPAGGQVSSIENHGVILAGGFVGKSGVSVLITEEPGTYFLYRTAPTGATLARELRWQIPHEEDFAGGGSLGPYCGP